MRRRPFIDSKQTPRRLFDDVARLLAATPRTWLFSVAVALALVVLATSFRAALQGLVGERATFAFYYLAVTLAAVLGGYRAGGISLAASSAAGWLLFAQPRRVFAPLSSAEATLLVIFVVSAGLNGLIAASLRHAVLQLRDRDLELGLIADELRHRVKNVLFLVQGVSRQISRTAPDVDAFQAAFEARLKALANAHDILGRSGWAGAGLRELIGAHLNPFVAPDGPSLLLEGEDLTLDPETALSLSLVLHELATNAVKYGCLSAPTGELRLSWRCDKDTLALDWLERGGPSVAPPARKGFGAIIIERTLAPGSRIDYEPAGLHVLAAVPLGRGTPAIRAAPLQAAAGSKTPAALK